LGPVASGRNREPFDRRGREREGSLSPPARLACKRNLLWNEEKDLAHPPQPHVRKKLEPWRSQWNDPAAVGNLNGPRVGELTVFLDRAAAF